MDETTDLKQLIRSIMKNGKATQTSTAPVVVGKAKGTRRQPRSDEHGKLGDFTRSNSNPPSRSVSNTAIIGYEEVPKTRLSAAHADGQSITAETEMIRKAIKLVLSQTGGAPSKRQAKRAASPKMTRSDRVFASGKGCGPGSSRSVTLNTIKAVAATETGCIVRDPNNVITPSQSARNANTTQGNYNPTIVEKA